MIEIAEVSYRYRKTLALDRVSFQIEPCQRYAILGPNGSGKSTLFRILSTLVSPHSGTVTYFGSLAGKVRRRLGVLFQSPSLDKKLTGLENWKHHAHLYGIFGTALTKKIQDLTARLRLSDVLGQRVEKLSGGYQRRVELGKVLLTDPEILLLDEPTAGLDPMARDEFWALLEDSRREMGVTIVYSTHHFEEADSADGVLLLDHGKVVASGHPRVLTARLGHLWLRLESVRSRIISSALETQFGLSPVRKKTKVLADISAAHHRLAELQSFLTEQSIQMTIGKPTLSDVYFLRTQTETVPC